MLQVKTPVRNNIDWKKLIISVIGAVLVGSSGAVFTGKAVNSWYMNINRPWFTPPNWVFGPAWTLLFVLMGVAFYLVWKKGFKTKKGVVALRVYIFQFALNVAWSGIFFGMGAFWLAYVEILILWCLIYKTIESFTAIDRRAGMLLWPYFAWVSFASVLNLAVAWLN